VLDVLGALRQAVTGSIQLYPWARKKWRRRHFKRVFGERADEYFLAFGIMVVRPDLLALVPSGDSANRKNYPLVKPSRPHMAFSAQRVASSCEIRAVAYVVTMLNKDGDVLANVVTDEFIADKLDIDFISFGALSNLKTLDAFRNLSNDLVEYDTSLRCFVCKTNRHPLYRIRSRCDYGIILKIHPSQFPNRTWITCAGSGEWGTSGAACFLAKKWREIAEKVEQDNKFMAVIEVDEEQDESARLLELCRTAQETTAVSQRSL
jgi:hypothetical protein